MQAKYRGLAPPTSSSYLNYFLEKCLRFFGFWRAVDISYLIRSVLRVDVLLPRCGSRPRVRLLKYENRKKIWQVTISVCWLRLWVIFVRGTYALEAQAQVLSSDSFSFRIALREWQNWICTFSDSSQIFTCLLKCYWNKSAWIEVFYSLLMRCWVKVWRLTLEVGKVLWGGRRKEGRTGSSLEAIYLWTDTPSSSSHTRLSRPRRELDRKSFYFVSQVILGCSHLFHPQYTHLFPINPSAHQLFSIHCSEFNYFRRDRRGCFHR